MLNLLGKSQEMSNISRILNQSLLSLLVLWCSSCQNQPVEEGKNQQQVKEVTLLFTNDFESAFDPIPAFWREDLNFLGGAAELTTMIDSIRRSEPLVYLFDAGDMFTGTLSNRTQGELLMEMMITMDYDAMVIGNHEFDYGWKNFRLQKHRVPFPVLGANIFYKGTDIPYAQPYTIIEKEGFRVGVIGIIGQDARSVVIASNVDALEFRDPRETLRSTVDLLRPQVDVLVLLTHQGKTGPMQTDQEAHPEVWRDFEEDIELAGSVPGVDVHFAGHAHRGTEEPYRHPETGTLIMQTYGHGTRLGYMKLEIDSETRKILNYEGRLLVVDSERFEPDPIMQAKIEKYRAKYPELEEVVCRTEQRLVRKYNQESDLGNLFCDILRDHTGSQISFFNSGGLRADLPQGPVTVANMLDAFPFQDRIWTLNMTGTQVRSVLEQGLTLERGIIQTSGLYATYEPGNQPGERLNEVKIGDEILVDKQTYLVSTVGVIAEGGDLYSAFTEAQVVNDKGEYFGEVLESYLRNNSPIKVPVRGRLIPAR